MLERVSGPFRSSTGFPVGIIDDDVDPWVGQEPIDRIRAGTDRREVRIDVADQCDRSGVVVCTDASAP